MEKKYFWKYILLGINPQKKAPRILLQKASKLDVLILFLLFSLCSLLFPPKLFTPRCGWKANTKMKRKKKELDGRKQILINGGTLAQN